MVYSFLHFVRGIRQHGVWEVIRQIIHHDRYLGGKFVGQDSQGNRYYEATDPETVFARERYVEYAKGKNKFDATEIEPQWHGWLHRSVDVAPHNHKFTVNKFDPKEHAPNFTGTHKKYVPYSTTKPKIQAWNPNLPKSQ